MHNFLKQYLRERKVIHLDFASTTPVHPEVYRAMVPYFSDEWANPSAIYASGVRARQVIESCRTELARLLHIRNTGVIFTGGGTESNNLALVGTIEALRKAGRQYYDMEIITLPTEHPSILETLEMLEERGVTITDAPVGGDGLINVHTFESLLREKTVLVTCAYVNSEIGVTQPVRHITRVVRAWNAKNGTAVRVHTDASQAPLWLPCALDQLGVDLMTLDAGKCYGPKGGGVLAFQHGTPLAPIMGGGGQEGGLRSGTENTPLIVGTTRALVRAQEGWAARSKRVRALRDHLLAILIKNIPGVVVNGSVTERVANNSNVSIEGLDAEFAVITLDAAGIAVATKSACSTGTGSGSSVVRVIGGDEARAQSTLRFTLGEETTTRDIERAAEVLQKHVRKTLDFQYKDENRGEIDKSS